MLITDKKHNKETIPVIKHQTFKKYCPETDKLGHKSLPLPAFKAVA